MNALPTNETAALIEHPNHGTIPNLVVPLIVAPETEPASQPGGGCADCSQIERASWLPGWHRPEQGDAYAADTTLVTSGTASSTSVQIGSQDVDGLVSEATRADFGG